MKAFTGSSSLIKLYHQEEGSDFVVEVLSNDVVKYSYQSLPSWSSAQPYGRK